MCIRDRFSSRRLSRRARTNGRKEKTAPKRPIARRRLRFDAATSGELRRLLMTRRSRRGYSGEPDFEAWSALDTADTRAFCSPTPRCSASKRRDRTASPSAIREARGRARTWRRSKATWISIFETPTRLRRRDYRRRRAAAMRRSRLRSPASRRIRARARRRTAPPTSRSTRPRARSSRRFRTSRRRVETPRTRLTARNSAVPRPRTPP